MIKRKMQLVLKDNTLSPGDNLEGTFQFTLPTRLRVNCVELKFIGDTKIEWRAIGGTGKKRHAEYVQDIREHVNFSIKLTDGGWLANGEFNYTFKLKLPDNLPQSWKTSFGRTRYKVCGVIDIPWAFDKTVEQEYFIFVGPTATEQQLKPCSISSQKIFGIIYKEKPVTVELTLKKTWFEIGEQTIAELHIDNESERQIDRCSLAIVRNSLFCAKDRNKRSSQTIWEQKLACCCLPGQNKTQEIAFTMPSSFSDQHGIAQLTHVLVFSYGSSQGINTKTQLQIPITLCRKL